MDTRRLGFALVVALLISVGLTSLFYVRVSRQQAAARPKTMRIVAAAAALQPGVPITADNLTDIDWPQSVHVEGTITNHDDVVGHVLIASLSANEPILRRDLASEASIGLAAKIPDGMRAVAVKTNEVNNVAGFLIPGSKVDVLVTLRGENNDTSARTVLQNVRVLSAGSKTEPDPQGKPENVNVVTLLVSPEESEKLALAQQQGSIQFVLRNGTDSQTGNTPAVDLAQLTGAPAKKALPAEFANAGRKHRDETYTVETIAAGKTTVAKFKNSTE